MPVVDAKGIRKSYGARAILDGVDLTIHGQQRVGLVGDNGCGKSTLARILAGVEPNDGGELAVRRGARIGYLEQAPQFEAGRTALQEVLAGLGPWNVAMERHTDASTQLERGEGDVDRWLAQQQSAAEEINRLGGWELSHQAESIMGHLGVPATGQSVESMSGGEQRRVALARLLVSGPDLAILDEPTNHLDVDTIEWLERYLQRDYPGAVLLITHDRYLLDRVATRTLELAQGHVHGFEGGYQAYLEAKALREQHEERAESNRQNFLRRELDWLRRSPKARTTKQKARVDRAEEALSQKAPTKQETAELRSAASRSGKTILELHGLGIELGGRQLVRDLDLFVQLGQRIGIVGRNGTGKTTLLRTVIGEMEPSEGRVVLGKNTKVAYLSQARGGLDDDKSIYDNFDDGPSRLTLGNEEVTLRAYLRRFLFSYEQQRQPVGSLSGGERTRVALARLLCRPSNLLVLDEPTNDLDLSALSAMEQMLLEYGGTVLVVTHDRWFLDRVATAILAPTGDGRWTRFEGDYSDYRLAADAMVAAPSPVTSKDRSASPAQRTPRGKRTLTYGERIELDGIEARIAEAEAATAFLEASLNDGDSQDHARVAKLGEDLAAANQKLESLIERWEQLESRKADAE